MKLMPVANGMIKEKAFVESALNKANAENTINRKATTKGTLSTNKSHSLMSVKALFRNCHLIKAAPVTLKAAYNKIYKIVLVIW
jgi:hypothetical protein